MSTPDNGSYISRFLVKFVEIIAAGLATAASGYLIAHLSATLSSSGPTNDRAKDRAAVTTPNLTERTALPAQPAAASSADNSQQLIIPQLTAPSGPQSASPQSASPQSPSPQSPSTTANIPKPDAQSRRSENSPKPAAGTRESWTVRVRAALANAAHRTDPPADAPHRSRPPASMTEPGPLTDSANSHAVTMTLPAGTDGRAAPLQAATQAAGQAGGQAAGITTSPPTVIEVKPVVPIQPSPAPTEKAPGALSTLEQMLRNDPLAGSDQVPRPPMPVGQE